jgi:hypothetical protein
MRMFKQALSFCHCLRNMYRFTRDLRMCFGLHSAKRVVKTECHEIYALCLHLSGARGSVVGLGTMLQAGRSRDQFPMRSLDFHLT